jgi:hypothetical protein
MNIAQDTGTMQLRKAQKSKSKLRIGISGPSGSGKTYSALLLASGLTNEWAKICVIDTENGSADVYDNLGAYNVITLVAPYSPERYIEAIKAAEKAGMEIVIVDSTSHEWDGKGGCLESNELLAQSKFKGNSWAAWSQTTPRHQRFIEALVTSSCHIITTARSKTDTIQVDKQVKKIGTKEIQREGFEYELTLNFNLDRDSHLAMASKDRTGLFIDSDPAIITQETGKRLRKWADSGIDLEKIAAEQEAKRIAEEEAVKAKAKAEKEAKEAAEKKAVLNALKTLKDLIQKKGKSEAGVIEAYKVKNLEDMSMNQVNHAMNKLIVLPDFEPGDDVNPDEAEEGIKQMKAEEPGSATG